MTDNRPDPDDTSKTAQVLHFRPRRRVDPSPARSPAGKPLDPDNDTLDDLAQYEEGEDEVIDYRHRMLMNVIAIAVVMLLIGFGVWITDTISDLQREQDCMMQGRGNCAPIEVPEPSNQ